MVIDRRKQNIGHPWQSEGDRRNVNIPVALIPLVKEIAYKLDAAQVTDGHSVTIEVKESEVILKISTN